MANRRDLEGPLTERESALCELIDETSAVARRVDLWAMYEIAGYLQEHKIAAADHLRRSLIRCGRRLDSHRTTLLRYAFLHQRIRPGEFEQLIALSDVRGSPATFWDIVKVADLSLKERRDEIARQLSAKSIKQQKRWEQGGDADEAGPRESSTRLRAAPRSQAGPELAREGQVSSGPDASEIERSRCG